MPELPEVEAVVRWLNTLVRGRTITTAELFRERLAPTVAPAEFAALLRQTRINEVARRGKHILIGLDNGHTLIVHLRMSGRFVLKATDSDAPKFTHAAFSLDDGRELIFQDQRHFGYMNIVATELLFETPELAKLAPEPFSEVFDSKYILGVSQRSSKPIKELLIDQTKFTGLGNIYASEALFLARVNPATRSNRISPGKAEAIFRSIHHVFDKALEFGASVPIDPENIDRSNYSSSSDPAWLVYDREGQPCISCGTLIRRIKQGGRSTYYCPRCQRKAPDPRA